MLTDPEIRVRCTAHGPMPHVRARYGWYCGGWDGEGCECYFTYAQMLAASMRRPSGDNPVHALVDRDYLHWLLRQGGWRQLVSS